VKAIRTAQNSSLITHLARLHGEITLSALLGCPATTETVQRFELAGYALLTWLLQQEYCGLEIWVIYVGKLLLPGNNCKLELWGMLL
jgi:hypothetical protein